jgi:hypothetical protein
MAGGKPLEALTEVVADLRALGYVPAGHHFHGGENRALSTPAPCFEIR